MKRKSLKNNYLLRGPFILIGFALIYLMACAPKDPLQQIHLVTPNQPLNIKYDVKGSLIKQFNVDIDNLSHYALIDVYANNELIAESIDIPKSGSQTINTLVRFKALGNVTLSIKVNGGDLHFNSIKFKDITGLNVPEYQDISQQAGLEKVNSIKYGGPSIADIDNDGDYDFIVNNHNEANSKLYWNNGDGTVTVHEKNLSRWFMHDVHGTAAGDFDNDGDLDLVVTQGGGNGTDPSKANFYQNNDGKLVLMTGDVGIDKGGRGRGARWSDMDLDGDLDLMLINELGLKGEQPQHFFYENLGDSTFKYKQIPGLQDVHPSRVLLTDINNDHIDDIILYSPLSVWLGNGDFTFTDVSSQIPADVAAMHNVMAMADLDIDNDGDIDLYLARGKEFEGGSGETPSMDFDPISKEFSIKPRGFKGTDKFDFSANGAIRLHSYKFLAQGIYRDRDYPLFLGETKSETLLANGDELDIKPALAKGWPDDISANGMYFGYLGNGQWKAALVREGDVFWGFQFSLSGISSVSPEFVPQNRNEADVLLRNDGGKFTNVSSQWNIQEGANSLGVTVGDFNNDSFTDIFVSRWGQINKKTSDYMLLNTGKGRFETVTMHGANDIGGPGNGDMGQAFDFDLDGGLDFLNGSEGGQWYLYANKQVNQGNYALVRVGYSPISNVDAIAAEVTVKTAGHTYRRRVGSAGEIFSQSLLNIVHFGLGEEQKIESIQVRWRDGTKVEFKDKLANNIYDTDKVDPLTIRIVPKIQTLRQGSSLQLSAIIQPNNADKQVSWSSSDESVLVVDEHGVVSAIGDVTQSATISATSPLNSLVASSKVTIEKWVAKPIESLQILAPVDAMVAGQTLVLSAHIQPNQTDDKNLRWHSSNPTVATVDARGQVTALQDGNVIIKVISEANKAVSDQIKIDIKPFTKPFINILNAKEIAQTDFSVGDNIIINVKYHAGTGNEVIASDEGGVRFWFRHFKNKWIPQKDTILIDASALKTESGSSSMRFSLEGVTPSAALPDGQFYYIRASFTSSNGNVYDSEIFPIKIVGKQ